jgi:predicted nucleotidyltransferase
MDLSRPYAAVSPTLDGDVLNTLAGTTRPLTGRQVAKLARKGTPPGVQRALHRLVGHGLVHAVEAGRAILYTLNREHVASPAIEILADLRSELVRRLRNHIASWRRQPANATLFGSAARGDGDVESDIDVFLVRPQGTGDEEPEWREKVEELVTSIREWTGNHAALIEVSIDDVDRLQQQDAAIVGELEADGVVLAGLSVKEILRGLP